MMNERFMVQGKRLNNGEVVQGFYCFWVDHCYPDGLHNIYAPPDEDDADVEGIDMRHMECYEVDPATVEPVAVKVTSDNAFGKCPNCEKEFNSELQSEYEINYCPWCGQRLDWGGGDEG